MSERTLNVGGMAVDYAKAAGWAEDYLVKSLGKSAYPAYDAYEGSGKDNPRLGQADLLAPALLNVSRNPVPTFYGLEGIRGTLNERLEMIPVGITLDRADQSLLADVAALFAVLDDPAPKHIRMTVLSKVLARKRPGLIPVFDRFVGRCYTYGANPPVPSVRKRTREGYALAWLVAVRADLLDRQEEWEKLAAIAPAGQVPISPLRALDIVAWNAGKEDLGGSDEDEEDGD
ncbi:DUF6308 family protein [Sinomonas albida]|uniref:DUF6308 family protein n=1 Tax=Sinomonas albida TaxID=369942 RepID=UPI003017A4F5